MSESDGIEDAVEGSVRIALTVAGQVGERLARSREASARQGQAASEQHALELQGRLDGERGAA